MIQDDISILEYYKKGKLEEIKNFLKITSNSYNEWAEKQKEIAFYVFVREGNLEMVESFLENGFDPNIQDNGGNNVIHLAARGRNLELIKLLMSRVDIDINAFNNNDTSVFMIAAQGAIKDNNTEILQYLLEQGADINLKGRDTALHKAASSGSVFLIEYLVDSGANINSRDFKGNTPLHRAAFYSMPDAVECLLSKGCDANITNLNEKTADLVTNSKTIANVIAAHIDPTIFEAKEREYEKVKELSEVITAEDIVNSESENNGYNAGDEDDTGNTILDAKNSTSNLSKGFFSFSSPISLNSIISIPGKVSGAASSLYSTVKNNIYSSNQLESSEEDDSSDAQDSEKEVVEESEATKDVDTKNKSSGGNFVLNESVDQDTVEESANEEDINSLLSNNDSGAESQSDVQDEIDFALSGDISHNHDDLG